MCIVGNSSFCVFVCLFYSFIRSFVALCQRVFYLFLIQSVPFHFGFIFTFLIVFMQACHLYFWSNTSWNLLWFIFAVRHSICATTQNERSDERISVEMKGRTLRTRRFGIILVYLSGENIYFRTYYVNLITTETLSSTPPGAAAVCYLLGCIEIYLDFSCHTHQILMFHSLTFFCAVLFFHSSKW